MMVSFKNFFYFDVSFWGRVWKGEKKDVSLHSLEKKEVLKLRDIGSRVQEKKKRRFYDELIK